MWHVSYYLHYHYVMNLTTMGFRLGRIFPGGGSLVDSKKKISRGPKVVKFNFSHSKLRKQPFTEIFKIQVEPCPLPTLMLTILSVQLQIYATKCMENFDHLKRWSLN